MCSSTRPIALCSVSFAVLLSALASAQPKARVRLDYERQKGAEACPDQRALEDEVATHLGYRPFVESAPLSTQVKIEKRGARLVAEVRVFEQPGNKPAGKRSLDSSALDCRELGAALALALSIAIDPVAVERRAEAPAPPESPEPRPGPPPTAAPKPRPTAAPLPPPTRQPTHDSPFWLRVAGGAHASSGTTPSLALGPWLYAGARRDWFSFGLEGRADLPVGEKAVGAGSVEATAYLGTLLPCFHEGIFGGCGTFSLGGLHGTGSGVTEPETQTTFYSSAGARVAVELAVSNRLSLTSFVGFAVTLTPTALELDGEEAWKTPVASANLGIGIVFEPASDGKR